ncbi:MAG: hypothetical protein V4671_21060 [Armatimonadota bacterium]
MKSMKSMRLSRFHCATAAAATVAVLGLFNAAPAAHANTIVNLASVTPAAGGTRFTYNAAFVATPGSVTLESGDFFTIYDFGGLVGGSNSQPAGWTFSSALFGPQAESTATFVDDPAVSNLTWTYTGATLTTTTTFTGFSVLSLFGGQRGDFYSAENTQRFDGVPGSYTASNIGQVNVAAAAAVPEPSEWLAMGMAATSVGGLMFRAKLKLRSKRQQVAA